MTTHTETPLSRDVPTGGTSTLRVTRTRDESTADRIVIAHGFGTGADFHRPAFCGSPITIPAGALADLRAALEDLDR